MRIDRRNILKAGLAGLPFCSLSNSLSAMAGLAPSFPTRRMLTIFLRGGNDGLNTVVPFLDAGYLAKRPNIGFTPPGSTIGTPCLGIPGYGAVGLHPNLDRVLPLLATNRMALLHRVGNFSGQRSHFTEMHLLETGRVDASATSGGFLPQMAVPLASTASLPLVSISDRQQRMYLPETRPSGQPADIPGTHIQKAYSSGTNRQFAIPFGDPALPAGSVTNAVRAAVVNTGIPAYPTAGQGQYARSNVVGAIDAVNQLRTILPGFTHDGVSYPSLPTDPLPPGGNWPIVRYAGFFERLEEAVRLLRAGLSNCVGLELGGFDTHNDQLAEHAQLMSVLGHAIRSAHDDLAAGNDDFLILVVSEFGRTIKDNGDPNGNTNGAGTDHGVGGVYMVAGSRVRAGVYNCTFPGWVQLVGTPTGVVHWRPLNNAASIPLFENALEPATDFRVPLIEIAQAFFGLSTQQIAALPGVGAEWSGILTNPPTTQTQMLGFIV